MKMFIASVLVVVTGGLISNNLNSHNDCAGFLPKNEFKIPVTATFNNNNGGLTEREFNEVIDRVESVYTDIIAETGNELDIRRFWGDDSVNASARQVRKTWEVNMYGGLARHPAIGVEAFTTVLCHEIGHHLGGAPKKGFLTWASNEGQADYYASTKCMRKLYNDEENEDYIANIELNEYAKSACNHVFANNTNELASCYRSARAGQDIAIMFKDLNQMDITPEFDTPDPKIVSRTDDNHPEPQCRLDTYFQGALCSISHEESFDHSDETVAACNRGAQVAMAELGLPEEMGVRPLCWFKPSTENALPLAGL